MQIIMNGNEESSKYLKGKQKSAMKNTFAQEFNLTKKRDYETIREKKVK